MNGECVRRIVGYAWIVVDLSTIKMQPTSCVFIRNCGLGRPWDRRVRSKGQSDMCLEALLCAQNSWNSVRCVWRHYFVLRILGTVGS